jgi:YidC/Oxa1 family membrane protein insertase
MGLREMSNLPVASMREGGILWFADLTVPDQFYLLPIITSATLALTIEVPYLTLGIKIIFFDFYRNFIV